MRPSEIIAMAMDYCYRCYARGTVPDPAIKAWYARRLLVALGY